ncbi:EF-hand domain-containing protein [Bdellovibrio bacteriovorus]|uniref:EF-hand domain-containing protein n=1 Tax=Bdellovibrio bacteriovorus TaxID=959 RepID=UPI0021D16B9C|nr:EF-hand domain-containing protein [Bdellovibrio bacteriovorus]UXR66163.1 EF-hand domain-containing protein [Bdellovibrio bacteriovorus]
MFMRKGLCAAAVLLASNVVYAQSEQQPAAVNSGAGGSAGFQGVVLSGQATRASSDGVTINVANTCFGTNLRHVSNPISPASQVKIKITMNVKGAMKTYEVLYPANIVMKAGETDVAVIKHDTVKASYAGNNVRIVLPINFNTTVDEQGNISDDFEAKLEAIKFEQVFDARQKQEFMGFNGDLSATVYTSGSKDGRQYSISAFFPGENGYCGGYFSPLMVFFDDKLPQFSAAVDFPLNPTGKTMWPEAGAPGAFIAVDRNGDGLITTEDELFGNQGDKYKNGFEALREFDSNKDDVIDKKDKDFAKLLLWFDKNGDGKVQKGELVPLKSRIESVSLKYDASAVSSVADRAEIREKSTFVFKEKGKKKEGRVIDMWFSPKMK